MNPEKPFKWVETPKTEEELEAEKPQYVKDLEEEARKLEENMKMWAGIETPRINTD